MSETTVASVKYGEQHWQRSGGRYFVVMWGWWPNGGERPSSRWVEVEDHRVPAAVKRAFGDA